ncbi:hypothetical protein EE612_049686 [Oryza sativa]|nr:hypothetical protein EE612_049686 [Oryza sativa]
MSIVVSKSAPVVVRPTLPPVKTSGSKIVLSPMDKLSAMTPTTVLLAFDHPTRRNTSRAVSLKHLSTTILSPAAFPATTTAAIFTSTAPARSSERRSRPRPPTAPWRSSRVSSTTSPLTPRRRWCSSSPSTARPTTTTYLTVCCGCRSPRCPPEASSSG